VTERTNQLHSTPELIRSKTPTITLKPKLPLALARQLATKLRLAQFTVGDFLAGIRIVCALGVGFLSDFLAAALSAKVSAKVL
jgi:hypothetical protein